MAAKGKNYERYESEFVDSRESRLTGSKEVQTREKEFLILW